WFTDPGPMSAVVDQVTRYGLLDWFIYEGKVFQLRRPGSYGRVWRAPATITTIEGDAGPDAQRLWESIVVTWPDVDGTTPTAGPAGHGAQFIADGLRVTDPDHPAVKYAGNRNDLLVLQDVIDPAGAIAAAERWLSDANELPRAGRASYSGFLMDDKSVMRPVS